MKKILALLLALVMVFALFACGSTEKATDTDKKTETKTDAKTDAKTDDAKKADAGDAAKEEGGDSSTTTDYSLASGFGLFDENFDYSSMKKFKVVGMFHSMGAMYQEMDLYFGVWADRMNCDYTMFDAGSDSDAFITAIETYAGQGVDGVFICPDSPVIPRVVEVLEENEMTYMSTFTAATNSAGEYQHPFVGADFYGIGHTLGAYVAEYIETVEGFNLDEAMMTTIDWSVSNDIHMRDIGAWYAWDEHFNDDGAHYLYMDAVSEGAMNEEAGYNLMAAAIVANPNVKYWSVVSCASESVAIGAARAIDDFKLTDTSIVVNNGIDSVWQQWAAGTDTAFRAGIFIPNATRTNAYFGALYAFMAGWCTPEDIWPDCTPEGETYAYVVLHPNVVTSESFKSIYGWADYIGGYERFGFEYDGTNYTAYETIDSYPMLWSQVTFDPVNGQLTKE